MSEEKQARMFLREMERALGSVSDHLDAGQVDAAEMGLEEIGAAAEMEQSPFQPARVRAVLDLVRANRIKAAEVVLGELHEDVLVKLLSTVRAENARRTA